jgi:predicted ester cyclase
MDEMIHRFYNDLWNRWADAAVDDLLTDDFIFRGSLGTETTGRTEWRRYRDTIRAGSADFHNHIITLVTDGSSAAARLRYTGTHTGPFADIPPTGRAFTYAGAAFFTKRNNQLSSAWALGDLTDLRGQLTDSSPSPLGHRQ